MSRAKKRTADAEPVELPAVAMANPPSMRSQAAATTPIAANANSAATRRRASRSTAVQRRASRLPQQLELRLPTRGGRRPGAGRPPGPDGPGVPHVRRPDFDGERCAIHVTVRVRKHVFNLRSGRCFKPVKKGFQSAKKRFGLRLCHFAVLGNHIHFVVEADDRKALSRAMKGIGVRIAKALNRVMDKSGAVYADRYHARVLKTPREVAIALRYVLENARHHGFHDGPDPDDYCSQCHGDAAVDPATWLLAVGYERAGPVVLV